MAIADLPDIEPAAESRREPKINVLFRTVMKYEASDLHLKVNLPPMMRLKGVIRKMEAPPISEDMERLFFEIMTPKQRHQLEEDGRRRLRLGHRVGRVPFPRQHPQAARPLGMVARRVNATVPTFEGLGLPPSIEHCANTIRDDHPGWRDRVGQVDHHRIHARLPERTRSIAHSDHRGPDRIPVQGQKSVVNQREVGIDVIDWHTALKDAVREDPDVILVGEMRDRDTFEAAIHAAETGHLVFGTIHASSSASTLGRILDLFPADMHQAIRQTLAFNLKAVVAQKLLPSIKPGRHRTPTNEIMIINPTIRDLIIKGEDKKISDAIKIGYLEGMVDFTENLRQLVERGDVTKEVALEVAPNPDALKMAIKGIKVATPGIL